MAHIIEITEDRMESLSSHLEQGLRHLGKAMQFVDDCMQESGFGERGRIYSRGYGRRDDDDMDDDREYDDRDDDMGERSPRYGRGYDDMGERSPRYWRGYGERRGGRRRDSRGRYM